MGTDAQSTDSIVTMRCHIKIYKSIFMDGNIQYKRLMVVCGVIWCVIWELLLLDSQNC